jgi:dienelactone hydrolase
MFRTAWIVLVLTALVTVGAAGQEDLNPNKEGGNKENPPQPNPESPLQNPHLPRTLSTEEDFQQAHQPPAEEGIASVDSLIAILGGDTSVYLALPPELHPPMAGVILLSEGPKVDERTRMWADRLADRGYVALSLVVHAAGSDPSAADTAGIEQARAFHALDAAAKALSDDPRLGVDRIGCVAWEGGGTWALRYATSPATFDALVTFDAAPRLDAGLLRQVRFPMLTIFAGRDPNFSTTRVDEFEASLKGAGVAARAVRVDAEPSFADPSSPNYDRESAALAWEQVQPFLEKYVKKGP